MFQQLPATSQSLSARCPDGNQIGALVEGKLDAAAAAPITDHLDTCMACQDLVAFAIRAAGSIAPPPPPGDPAPARPAVERAAGSLVGRYEILARIGAGAMGVVYRAADPKLDREIALKVVRDETADSRARLEDEAQLAARLQHPNVVTIYDAGAVDDAEVFVAMEYVDGPTLAEWLRAPRRRDEILDVFGQAAAGLAAAHAAGLVHRDFKPSNVLVGKDRRVRVADFGLARRVAEPARASAAPPSSELAAGTPSAPGPIIGSPAYMAPEQHRGQLADATSDQFAFCVALHEAVYGVRPFRGANVEQLTAAVLEGRIDDAPRGTRVPAWLRDVILRGLSVQRDRRFASMDQLAAALDRGRAPRWQRRVVACAAVAALAVGGGWIVHDRHRAATCHGERAQISALFDDGHAATLARAFAATGAPFAASSAERTSAVLRRYTHDLADGAEAACFAAPDEPARLADGRRTCFAARTAALGALISSLEHADRAAVQRAVDDAWSGAERAPCADNAALLASSQTSHALTADQVARLGEAQGLLQAGHAREGIALVEPLLAAARADHDRVAELVASLRLAPLEALAGHGDQAVPLIHAAVTLAEAQGFDDDAFAAYGLLAGNLDPHADAAARHRYADLARAKLERTGRSGGALDAKLSLVEAQILQDEFRFPEAEQLVRRAVDISTREFGPDHPTLGLALGTLGVILRAEHRPADELDTQTRALGVLERALGADHPSVAGAKLNLAGVLIDVGRLDDARKLLLEADATFASALGPDHPSRGRVLANLADVDNAAQHWDAARDELTRALAIVEHSRGPQSVDAGDVHFALAQTLAGAQRYDDSLAEAQRSLAILEAALGKDHGHLINELLLIAELDLQQGHAAAAIPVADRALTLLTARPDHPETELAEPRMILARALWDGHGDHNRSRALAEQAAAAQGDLGHIDHAQVADWLTEHPKPTR